MSAQIPAGATAAASDTLIPIRRALLSVWRKDGLAEAGRRLAEQKVELVSTGGSARALSEAGLEVLEVASLTDFPEMLDGRVKTLHPKVHGGLLYVRGDEGHEAAVREHGITPLDLLVVDLYPFEAKAADPSAAPAEVIEMIDVGGPAMIRGAAKNHRHVVVVTDPEDLSALLDELEEKGGISTGTAARMAAKAFRRTAAYDAAIADWMLAQEEGSGSQGPLPERLPVALERIVGARYGENPHQAAAIYARPTRIPGTLANAEALSGKALSYNNWLDASAALEAVRHLPEHGTAIVKHRNLCGAAIDADSAVMAFQRALEGDPRSAFGGIVAHRGTLTLELAAAIADPSCFFEVVVAEHVADGVVELFEERVRWGKSVRLVAVGEMAEADSSIELRSVSGVLLAQQPDTPGSQADWQTVSKREPTPAELRDLAFANEICRHLTSNAIAIVKDGMLLGSGSGQTSRVEAVEGAVRKAGERARGAVLASDAFFPFADGLEAGLKAGVIAVVQPGGSKRDQEVIDAADAGKVAMVFTSRRHFRH